MQQQAISIDRVGAGGYAAVLGLGTLSAGLERLIEDFRIALSTDLEAAKQCLDRLSAEINARSSCAVESIAPNLRLVANREPQKGGLASWQIRKIDEHIRVNLHATISIDTLSEIARLSNGHFCRVFKISMGETPHSYIRRKRIELAQTLMRESEVSLSQIAVACGLADQSHLTRLFHKYVGQTPLSWRRAWKTEASSPSVQPAAHSSR